MNLALPLCEIEPDLKVTRDSDSHFAKFALEYDLGDNFVNTLLKMLHSPSFKASELSFASAEDLHAYVRIRRREIASKRAGVTGQIGTGGMPYIVLQCVVDHVSELLKTYNIHNDHLDMKPSNSKSHRELKNLMINMSLAHRTWTPIVQLAMRQRVRLSAFTAVRHYLQSPFCGPWVYEMSVDLDWLRHWKGEKSVKDSLLAVISPSPNISRLYIFHVIPGAKSLRSIISLKHLRSLVLQELPYGRRTKVGIFPEVCEVIPNLKQLEALSIYRLNFARKFSSLPDKNRRIVSKCPPSSLKKIRLQFRTDSSGINTQLVWLLKARRGYRPKIVRIEGELMNDHQSVFDVAAGRLCCSNFFLKSMKTTLPYLETFELNLSHCGTPVGSNEALYKTVSMCTNLKTLFISHLPDVHGGQPWTLMLPRSLQTVIFNHDSLNESKFTIKGLQDLFETNARNLTYLRKVVCKRDKCKLDVIEYMSSACSSKGWELHLISKEEPDWEEDSTEEDLTDSEEDLTDSDVFY